MRVRASCPILPAISSLVLSACYPASPFDYEEPIPVREECDRWEEPLPLATAAGDSIISFVERGGRCRESGTGASTPGDLPQFRALLALLTDSSSCLVDSLQGNLKRWSIKIDHRGVSVYDAREHYGPDRKMRHAYLVQGYWLICIIQTDVGGMPVLPRQWRYTRLIVEKDFAVSGPR